MALFDSQFYRPSRQEYDAPENYGLEYEPVTFVARDGVRLSGWWFPAEGSAIGTVVHCHGNAGNITGHFVQTAWLPAEGYNVLCFDYRGYGCSEGRVTRSGTIADAHAAVDHAMAREGAGPVVLLFGQSLGGTVAIVVAAERDDLAGVAVDGAFSDYRQEVAWVLSRQWLTRSVAKLIARFGISRGHDAIDCVDRVAPTPLFLMHGKEDRTCPWEMSQDLYDRAKEPKGLWLIPDAGHYEALNELAEIGRPKLTDFFRACAEAVNIKRRTAGGTPLA